MKNKLEVCSCCGKLVPADILEISFKFPDDIAKLREPERSSRIKGNDDAVALDSTRYFVRGLIPLPVNGRDIPYCIGAWAEVGIDAYRRIYELWDDESQGNESPFQATLANSIPGHHKSNCYGLSLQLTGPSTRPDFKVTDEATELFKQQTTGITLHEVDDYNSWFR
ncbi:DUF2199 domain-containing protein [Sapientia aquatica]|uniref:DUF2199 domain-containing protein n=1 Tax=Sapientia aquatica TaxID=1549640 RepID=A0A4R5VMC8_9BURK|nr:DUF2199 domain-containing protein [Sapientia aquatica]TDK59284.1 DUF2199 domain-containing protein [Sapientia aquatica]